MATFGTLEYYMELGMGESVERVGIRRALHESIEVTEEVADDRREQ